MWSRLLLLALVFVALSAFACEPEPPDASGSGAAEATPLDLDPSAPQPPDPASSPATLVDDEASLGLFAPLVPGIGLDTHSSECDPFEDDSEICL